MTSIIRRVVTGHDRNGRSVVHVDGAPPNVQLRPTGGSTAHLMWVTDSTPADSASEGDPTLGDFPTPPPSRGSIFRITEFPPLKGDPGEIDANAYALERGIETPQLDAASRRHPFMHRTETVDYAIVLSGEIDMLLDEEDVHLRAGDVVIQRATNHAWVNRGNTPCRIAFILIDADGGGAD